MTEPSVTPAPTPVVGDDAAAAEPFEIRRRTWLFVLVLLSAWGLAGGYGWLAYDRDEPYLWVPTGALGLLGLAFAWLLRRMRTPLLVADLHGVRLLSRTGWVGFLWREMGDIEVERRHGLRQAAQVRVRGIDDDHDHTVPLGLATSCSAPRAEIELARRRNAASY